MVKFPVRCSFVWNSKKDWTVIYHKDDVTNDLDYITEVKLREIGRTIKISGKIKNNY